MSTTLSHRGHRDEEKLDDVTFPQKQHPDILHKTKQANFPHAQPPNTSGNTTQNTIQNENTPDVASTNNKEVTIHFSQNPLVRFCQTMVFSQLGERWAFDLSYKTEQYNVIQQFYIKMFPQIAEFKDHNSLLLSSVILSTAGAIIGACLSLTMFHISWFRTTFFIASAFAWSLHEFMITVLNHPDWPCDARQFAMFLRPLAILRMCTFAEYIMWSRFLAPSWYSRPLSVIISLLGITMVVIGRWGRSMAMLQCGVNFESEVRTNREKQNHLVQEGFYRFVRHPSYFFGIMWCGIYAVMQTPITGLIGTIFGIGLIYNRVVSEEAYLVKMYGEQYRQYQEEVPAIIPKMLGGSVGPVAQ